MDFNKALEKMWDDSGLYKAPDIDEEIIHKMTDHELLMLKLTEMNSYEEEMVIQEMNRRGFGPDE